MELRRAPDGGGLRQWRHGPVKVDPLAPLQAVERYLVIRGYGRSASRGGRWSDDSGSDEDIEDALVSEVDERCRTLCGTGSELPDVVMDELKCFTGILVYLGPAH